MDINYFYMEKITSIVLFPILIAFFISCTSAPPPAQEPPEKKNVPEEVKAPEQKQAPPPIKSSETEKPEEKTPKSQEEFKVTEELYKRTFEDINDVIEKLNTIIKNNEYDTWLTYLTDSYITETCKPDYLVKWQRDPRLIEKNITLRTLKDYFIYVVVPTRSQAKLDKIEFLDDTRVYAYTVFKGEQYLLYNLVKGDEGWKIDFY